MTLTTASVLAFERNLDISDAYFWQLDSASGNQRRPVGIQTKSVRGTISNRLKAAIANDPVKLDAEIEKPNLQTVDVASLDHDCDTLLVKWSCKVLPFTGKPSVCNDQDYQTKLLSVVDSYLAGQGVGELARRYACNIANARWLWRNRLGAETIKLTVSLNADGSNPIAEIANAKNLSLTSFDQADEAVAPIAQLIAQGLKGEAFVIFYIKAEVKMGYGQEVYPSQELILDTGKDKSKVLYQKKDIAGMHSQKISNAIRTIDTWYPEAQFPIAAEPYGTVTTLGTAFRQPKQKQDFYSLFDKWVLDDQLPSLEQQHYVMAVLIRGGVFGASGKGVSMDSYFELKAIPDAELLQSAVVAQLMQTVHGLLPAFEGDVGLSFPGYGQARTLGGILRFHGGRQQLEQLSHQLCQNPTINSYALVTEVNAVPDRINGHAIFQRLHVKGESRIKRWRKHNQENGTWTAEREQAVTAKYRENIICPHVALKSHSTGQSRFLLFIQRRVSGEEVEGKFNAYGLSKTATVPWF